jgi:hypothetical protein
MGVATRERRELSAVSFAVTLLMLAACSTENVEPANMLIPHEQVGTSQGGMVIQFAPSDPTYQQEQARVLTGGQTEYHIQVDGDYVYEPTTDGLWAVTVDQGSMYGAYFLPAGPHRFTIVKPGGASIFDGDGEIPEGGVERIFLFGPLDDLQGRLVAVPGVPTAGNEHLTVVNLASGGQAIEVVSCTDATTCTPLAPALALGDVFDGELPAFFNECDRPLDDPGPILDGCGTSLTTQGAGIGYRVVPSATLPSPPINPIYRGLDSGLALGLPGPLMGEVFIAAPVYLSDQGLAQFSFD